MTVRWQDYTLLQVLVCGLVLSDLQMCVMWWLFNFKILSEGKVPVDGPEFSCHDAFSKQAGISPFVTGRNTVFLA